MPLTAEMKTEQEDGKEYLAGREVKKINSHIVNKGSSHHEIHRPALLLLVSSTFHNRLLTLGGGERRQKIEHNEFHTTVIHSGQALS